MQINSEDTQKLVTLINDYASGSRETPLALELLKKLVLRGADVMALLPNMSAAVSIDTADPFYDIDDDDDDDEIDLGEVALNFLIAEEMLDAVKICLLSPAPLDFTHVAIFCTATPLHIAVSTVSSTGMGYNRQVIQAIVQRVIRCPRDRIDWKQTCGIYFQILDFISLAAHHQLLSTLWPEVKEVPYFADQVEPIALRGEVWAWDWEALGEVEQQRFKVDEPRNWRDASRSTGKLWRQLRSARKQPQGLEEIRSLVDQGADIMWRCSREFTRPLLLEMMDRGWVVVVEVLLESPLPMDFRIGDRDKSTALFFTVGQHVQSDDVQALICLLNRRGQRHGKQDISVDCGHRNRLGIDAISAAASFGHLSTFFKTVFHELSIPYFTQLVEKEGGVGTIDICCKVRESDWARIPVQDQARMVLRMGLIKDTEVQAVN